MWHQRRFKYWRRKPKYRNQVTTFGGRKYDSKFESKVAQDLEFQKRAGEIEEYEPQVNIPLYVYGVKITTYRADFRVFYKDGTEEIIEAKGFFTDYAKLKWRLFEAIYSVEKPNVKITMVRS